MKAPAVYPALTILEKGKSDTCKGRKYISTFEVAGFDEYLVENETSYTYNFMAKVEASFKREWKTQSADHQPNLRTNMPYSSLREDAGKQGTEQWRLKRSEFLTSTVPMTEGNLYKATAFRIARELGNIGETELANEIIRLETAESTFLMSRGSELEDVASNLYEKRFGVKLSEKGLQYFDNDFDILASSIDREYTDEDGKRICLEIKAPRYSSFLNPNNYTKYIDQCHRHYIVGNYDEVLLVEYFPTEELKITPIPYDSEIGNKIINEAIKLQKLSDDLVESAISKRIGF